MYQCLLTQYVFMTCRNFESTSTYKKEICTANKCYIIYEITWCNIFPTVLRYFFTLRDFCYVILLPTFNESINTRPKNFLWQARTKVEQKKSLPPREIQYAIKYFVYLKILIRTSQKVLSYTYLWWECCKQNTQKNGTFRQYFQIQW